MTTIRQMTPGDVDRVLEINAANVPEVGAVDRERLDFLVAQSTLALVADLGRSGAAGVVGFCIVLGPDSTYDSVNYRWFTDHSSDFWYLDRVAFDAEYQGRGLGTQMYAAVDAAIAAQRATGAAIDRLTLEVNVDPPNEQSLAFHARRHFVEVGRQQTPYGIEVSMQEKRY